MEFSEVEQCKTWEEEIYWKRFHAMHFYLVLPKDFHHHLVLPSKFAVHVSSKLPNKVSLIGPSRYTWDVEVSKIGSLALVGDGWKDFAKAYDLEENFLMLFKYKQNSSFEVLIFDQKSMCEKEFSYFVKKPFPKPNCRIDEKRKVVKAVITETVEDNDGGGGGGFESVLSRNSKTGASVNGNKNNPEAPKASPLDESSKDNYNDLDFVASYKARDNTILEKKMEVLSESDQSKKWEEEMYWEHFNAMHFYQVLPKDFHVHLVLPSKFAEHMSSKLPNKVPLTGPTGATWEITVSKNGSLALVGDEWKEFVKTYNLEENLLMIFKYKQNSSFEVLIFNQNNLCEKESSYFVKKCLSESGYGSNRKSSLVEAATSSLVEAATTELMEDYDSDNDIGSECVLSKKSKKEVSDEGQRISPEVPRTCSSDELTHNNHNDPGFVVANNAIDIIVETVGSGDRRNHHDLKSYVSNEVAAQDKGGINEAAKSKSQSEMNHSRRSCTEKGRQVKRVLPKSSKKPVLNSGTKRVAKEYMSNRRPVTSEEKKDAMRQAAEAFTKGSFMAVMCPTSVYKKFYLTIPADWMHENLPRRHQEVILRVGEKTWVTMYHSYSCRGFSGGLQAGWKNFVIENNLEDFDVCLFKLATKKDDATPILDVKIFRVVQETTPLSKSL